jgi:AraC-like DNA-binding protein
MAETVGGMSSMRFSTEELPEKDRVAFWCEVLGRNLAKIDFEVLPDVHFSRTATIRRLPGLSMVSGLSGGARTRRTRALAAEGGDDFILNILVSGGGQMSQLGRELDARSGEATLLSSADAFELVFPGPAQFISLTVPRPTLRTLVRDPEAVILRPILPHSEALRLLTGYLSALDDSNIEIDAGTTPALLHIFVKHVYDLVALAVGATSDATEEAKGGGLRAGRLHAIKADIMSNLGNDDLSVAAVALRHGVTPRYVQMLFETEGITFSQFVLVQRLKYAHRMLTDPRFAAHSISDIAYNVGFGDLSYFNRTFRRRYDATPSDARAEAASAR